MTHEEFAAGVAEVVGDRFLGALPSWSLMHDYRSFLEYSGRGKAMAPCLEAILAYARSPRKGCFGDLEFNERRRRNGGRTYPLKRWYQPTEEDLRYMVRNCSMAARRHPDAGLARDKFAEATRSSAFSLVLGVREIRLLGRNRWDEIHAFEVSEVAAMQRLLDKGLLVHTPGEDPRLSEAGELIRQLLVVSRHVCDKPEETVLTWPNAT